MKLLAGLLCCVFLVCGAEPDQPLAGVKRIYVDELFGGPAAKQMRDLLMSGLQGAKLWIITENAERADAFLRGSADNMIYNEIFDTRDGISVRASVSSKDGGISSSERRDRAASAGISDNEASRGVERKYEAITTVRLVNRDGDLIWSTTKESRGAKFRGSAADVTDKVVQQLVTDFEFARQGNVKK